MAKKTTLKRIKLEDFVPGLRVVCNDLPDATIYTVKSVDGMRGELVYMMGVQEASGGMIDYSVLYYAPARIIKAEKVECPTLEHDKMMLAKYDTKVSTNGVLERRIMVNLLAHLWANGFAVVSVDDGDSETPTTLPQDVLELVFNLDEAVLYVSQVDNKDSHSISIVCGEGFDMISDYTFYRDDRDNFEKVMEAFNAEDYA